MKDSLVPLLACPATGTPLTRIAFKTVVEEGAAGGCTDVEEGALVSASGHGYPVIGGVPRLIEGALELYASFRARWQRELEPILAASPNALAPPSASFKKIMLPTLRRFEREWTSHDLEGLTWGLDQPTRIGHFLRYVGLSGDELRGRWV